MNENIKNEKNNIKVELEPTERGFMRGEFIDANGNRCSIQESSNAEEKQIWLGFDEGKRMELTRDMVSALLPVLQKFVEKGELK